jgi:hypothetical protein
MFMETIVLEVLIPMESDKSVLWMFGHSTGEASFATVPLIIDHVNHLSETQAKLTLDSHQGSLSTCDAGR